MLYPSRCHVLVLAWFAACLSLPTLNATPAGAAGVNIDVYTALKALETTFPFPAEVASIEVGTFDAGTGEFSGLKSVPGQQKLRPVGSGDPVSDPVPASTEIHAIDAVLRFRMKNGSGEVMVNGASYPITSGGTAQVPVGTASSVSWTIRSGSRSYRDILLIGRPAVVGAGAFTIPALPVTIIYDPPQNRAGTNSASYASTQFMSTTTTAQWMSSSATQAPASTEYAPLMEMKSTMSTLSAGFSQIPNPYAQAAALALGAFAGGLGSASAEATSGWSAVREKCLVLSTQTGYAVTSSSHAGPGAGDVFVLLRNPRLVWLGRLESGQRKVSLSLLGWDGIIVTSAQKLKDDLRGWTANGAGYAPVTGLDARTIRAVLALDPFANVGARAALPGPRFKFIENYTLPGAGAVITIPILDQVTQADMNATTSMSALLTGYSKGWLGFAGIGVTEDRWTTTTQTYTASKQVTAGSTVTASVSLASDSSDVYAVDIYRDLVFGTIAVRLAGAAPPRYEGVATLAGGQLLRNAKVELVVGGRRYAAFTDAQGRYAFCSADMPAGTANLRIGGVERKVVVPTLRVAPAKVVTPARSLKPPASIRR